MEEAEEKQKKPHVIERYYSNGIPCYHITPLDDYIKPEDYTPIAVCVNLDQASRLSDFIEVVEKHTKTEIPLDKINQFIYDNNKVMGIDLTHIYDDDYFNKFLEDKAEEGLSGKTPEYLFDEANKGNINTLLVKDIESIRGHHKHDDWSPVQALVSLTSSRICPYEMSIQRCVRNWLINKHNLKEEEIPEQITPDFLTEVFNRSNAEKFIDRINK